MELILLTLNKTLLGLIILVSTLVVMALLIAGGNRRLANALFGFHFLIIEIQMIGHLFSYFLFDVAKYSQYNSALVLSIPPLLYLYTKALFSEKKWKFSTSHFVHFIPSIIGIIVGLNGLVLPPEHRVLLYVSSIAYGLSSASLVRIKFKNWIIVPYKKRTEYNWIKTLLYLFGLVLLADAILFFGFRFFGDYLMVMETFVLLTVLGYAIFPLSKLLNAKIRRSIFRFPSLWPKYIPTKMINLSSTSSSEVVSKLHNYMETHMPYLNPELTLSDVSQAIDVTNRELSEFINGHLGTNFISYVNSYRIKMAKQLLSNPDETELNISEIMYEVGFSSRSSFNTLFKKETGMTPSEYRESHLYRPTTPKPIIQRLQ
ncbi:helix-turn-helix transcriptional regulator [uncultured Croceitalea sp.]|uniref:helix-turn-helix domain-containing protein n=1 Tax=uncultured Croceitalea sp. TaxID=1798908 RepID=UPI00330650D2